MILQGITGNLNLVTYKLNKRRVKYRADAPLLGELTARIDIESAETPAQTEYELSKAISKVARADLERYYTLLRAELAQTDFTEAEARFICVALAQVPRPDDAAKLVPALADGVKLLKGRGQATETLDIRLLAHKLNALNNTQRLAIIDAAERCRIVDSTERATLIAVGLLREETE